MLLRRLTDFILRGPLQAVGAALVFLLVPVIGGSVSILIAILVTLRKGAFEGSLALCASTLPYLLSYAFYTNGTQAQMVLIAVNVMVAINVLTWLFALVLRRYSNWSLVTEVAALSGIVIVGMIYVFYPTVQDWWARELTGYFNKTASVLGQFSAETPILAPDVQASMVASLKQYATGFFVAVVVAMGLAQLILARWWQAVMFNPGGLRKELQRIRLSYVSDFVFVLVLGLAYLGSVLCIDLMPVLLMAFSVAGLSLIHRILISRRSGWFWLIVLYVGIVLSFPLGIVIVSIVALLDTVLDFRKRLRLI